MALMTKRCSVSQAPVTLITDFEGTVSRVICPDFCEPGRTCRLKQEALAGGRMSQLLMRLSEETLGERGVACHLL